VHVINGNSFDSFKFNYIFNQPKETTVVGIDGTVYDDFIEDGVPIGSTIFENSVSIWNKFYLVVKYIDEKGLHLSHSLINIR